MSRANPDRLSMSMDERVAAACRDAGRQAIEVAERTGTEIVIWRDGKIVRLTAAEARAEFDQKQDRSLGPGVTDQTD
ncbi:hypothetical protein SH449x_002688 [Pirellulaceae bacterium SH449]